MSFKDNADKPTLQSIISSLRRVYLKTLREISSNNLRVQTSGKASTIYSKLTLAAAQLVSKQTLASELSVNTRFCKGTPNPKNSEYRPTNTQLRKRKEDK